MGVYKLSANSVKNGRTIYGSMLAGNTAFVPPSFESIATVTVGAGGASTITFSSIPQTYTHLQLRCLTRSGTGSTSWQSLVFNSTFNSGTTGYANHFIKGNGSSATSTAELLGNRINFGETMGGTGLSDTFGVAIIDILDYANTNKNKTLRFLQGWDANGSGAVFFESGLWQSTNAITAIYVGPENFGGASYAQYSHFALYGIKSA